MSYASERGGVSLFAAQITAAISGARVTLISRSRTKLDQVLAHPEFHRFSHQITAVQFPVGQPWGKEIKAKVGEVDHVIEVGGAGTLSESLRAVRAGGVISLIGVLAGGGGS